MSTHDDGTTDEVVCPNCQSPAGEPCTVPNVNSRQPVRWFHLARKKPDTAPAKTYRLRCSGCNWARNITATVAQLNREAGLHDDSPSHHHVVTLDPPAPWPKDN